MTSDIQALMIKNILAARSFFLAIGVLVLMLFINGSALAETDPVPPASSLSGSDAIADIREAVNIIEEKHAAPFAHIDETQFQTVIAEEIERFDGKGEFTPRDMYLSITRLTDSLGCAHTFVNPAADYASWLSENARAFPLSIEIIKGRIFAADGEYAGTEIISIDGQASPLIVKELSAQVRIDGFGDHRKYGELARRFAYFYAAGIEDNPKKFLVEFAGGEGAISSVEFEPVEGVPTPKSTSDFVVSRRLEEGPIYLKVSGFYDQDSEGQFENFIKASDSLLSDNPERAVILDLRNNPGGIDGYGVKLLSLLSSKPFTVYDKITTRTPNDDASAYGVTIVETDQGVFEVTGAAGLATEEPMRAEPLSRLYVMVNSRTGSTAADVASHLHVFADAIVVGEETTGAYNANSSGFLDLHALEHSGIQLFIPRWRYLTTASKEEMKSRGVVPDYELSRVPSDISQGDPILDRVLRMVSDQP